jgi:hypothetical protein
MPPAEVDERLAELAACGVVEVVAWQPLTGDPLWKAIERTQYEGDSA